MLLLSATDLAIRSALKRSTLTVVEETGRFGPFWAISDDHGLIEVAMSAEEADKRVADCR